jgi:NADH:ubiquinone oxidoreductase subunit
MKSTDELAVGPDEKGEAVAALENFIVENEDLLSLELLIGKFNIFDAVKIARAEIRHSNFLAFLLDPAESHGHGQLFLTALLMDLLKNAPAHRRPLSPIELDGTQLRGVEVRREWNNIDLLITCSEPPLTVVIENKVGSSEHSDQLNRYEEAIKKYYGSARALLVYLTPSGDEPSAEGWVPYSYRDIHRVISRVRTTYRNSIGADVLVFLDHYLNLIGSRFMDDPQIDQLCQKIYKNHRLALQLIYDRVGSPAAGVLAEAEAALRGDSRWHVFYRGANLIDFVPADWLSWLPPIGTDRKDNPRSWFVFRLEIYDGKLDFYVEIRRMADISVRRRIVDTLIKEGARFGFKRSAGTVTDNYTRVSGRERVLQWNDEVDEPSEDLVRTAVNKKLDDVFSKIAGVPSILKPLLADLAET